MSNKGEERRERNLSDRKVPSIHLICRLGATWFQIWLRTETRARAHTHTTYTIYTQTRAEKTKRNPNTYQQRNRWKTTKHIH